MQTSAPLGQPPESRLSPSFRLKDTIAMSGFEIAGAVLGSIPLIISTLEHYQNGVRTIQRWRKYDRELQSLIRNLETERVKLQNVCERLLDGLVPPSKIDIMVKNPLGALWLEEKTQKKIRARLWTSWTVFEYTLGDLQKALGGIMDRLKEGGTVRSTSFACYHFISQRSRSNGPTVRQLSNNSRGLVLHSAARHMPIFSAPSGMA